MLTSWYYLYFIILCKQLKTKIDQRPWPLSCRCQSTPTLPLQCNEGGTALVLISLRPVFFHCFLVIFLKAGCRTNTTLWFQPFYCSFFFFSFLVRCLKLNFCCHVLVNNVYILLFVLLGIILIHLLPGAESYSSYSGFFWPLLVDTNLSCIQLLH